MTEDPLVAVLRQADTPDNVIEHCILVTRLADAIAAHCGADAETVHTAAMLHDIGRSRTHGFDHAVVGAGMLLDKGYPEAVVEAVRRHLGAGIHSQEAVRLGLPADDYTPRTLEEKVVCHADNLVAPEGYVPIETTIEQYERRGLPEVSERIRKMDAELAELCGRPLAEIVRTLF